MWNVRPPADVCLSFVDSIQTSVVDCWDGPNNEPLIYHGRTLTSRIRFRYARREGDTARSPAAFYRDVIEAVRDHAFAKSDYPVILSLENHCSHDQQRAMAAIMREVLGGMLWA